MARMISRIAKIYRSVVGLDIIKVFSLTALSTLVRMATGLISVKVVASLIGPSGIALLGQLNNFSTIILTLSNGGINNGITKYVAEFKNHDSYIASVLSTAIRITLGTSLVFGIVMIVCAGFLSQLTMLTTSYKSVFVVFGITLTLYSLNMMLTSILNGYKKFQLYVHANIWGSLLGLLFTITLTALWGIKGALIASVTFQSVMFFVTLVIVRRLPWVSKEFFMQSFDGAMAVKLSKYSLMAFITAITLPVSQLILRSYVMRSLSPGDAGIWEGMSRISTMYLMVITTSLAIYYLPRLSELQDKREIKMEIVKAYKIIIPLLFLGCVAIFLARGIIVKILFTPEFLPMKDLFLWQLIGDFFKIASWLFAFLMVAKAMTTTYVITELLCSSMFLLLGLLLVKQNGIIGLTQAYTINYVCYFIGMLVLFKRYLRAES